MRVDQFDTTSPADNRYCEPDVGRWLSPNGLTRAMLRVELRHAEDLARLGLCPPEALREIRRACRVVSAEEVAEREAKLRHDIRALVASINAHVSPATQAFVHLGLTSMDVKITAEMYNYQRLFGGVILPELMRLEQVLINLCIQEAATVQIGRTHFQHAVPITLGFALGEYVNRVGDGIVHLRQYVRELRGKLTGATGSANALLLLLCKPGAVLSYEERVLKGLSLKPAIQSTQLPPAEPRVRLMGEVTTIALVLYNLANDIRLMCSTEIREVEPASLRGGGSSAMPHKKNPEDFEKACSLARAILGKLVTVHLNQVSDFQRDLMDSASTRTYAETLSYFVTIVRTLNTALGQIRFDRGRMSENLLMTGGDVLAEAYKTLLAQYGCANADAIMRRVAEQSRADGRMFFEIAQSDPEVAPYLEMMSPEERRVLEHPCHYTGIASTVALNTAHTWSRRLGICTA